jgi:transposase
MGVLMAKRKRRSFTREFKAETVRLVLDNGKSISEVARDLDLTESALRLWVQQAKVDRGQGKPGELTTAEREELHRLRREVKDLRIEREILKKLSGAAAPPVGPETPFRMTISSSERSGRQLTGAFEPVKKHGPGVAADLTVVTPAGDPV